MRRRLQFVLAFLGIFTLVLATPASASSSVVHDPPGDSAADAYTDVVMAKVTAQAGRDDLFFHMVVAGAIPAAPSRSGQYNGFTAYNWLIDTNGDGIANYVVVVRFCSHTVQAACVGDAWHWESALTNTSTGRSIASFDFAVTDNVVNAFVAASDLGAPSVFRWIAATRSSPASSNLPSVDIAPNFVNGSPVWVDFAR
jgi:hypothetical protein